MRRRNISPPTLHILSISEISMCVQRGCLDGNIFRGRLSLLQEGWTLKSQMAFCRGSGSASPKEGSESPEPSATRQGPACRPTPRMSCLSECARPTLQCNVLETRVVYQRNTSTPLVWGELMRATTLEKPQITGSEQAGSTERRKRRNMKNSHVQNQARYSGKPEQ